MFLGKLCAQGTVGPRYAQATYASAPGDLAGASIHAAGPTILGPTNPAPAAPGRRSPPPRMAAVPAETPQQMFAPPPGGTPNLQPRFTPLAPPRYGAPSFSPPTAPPAQQAPQSQPVEYAEILAWVGDEFILAGEVLGTVDQIMQDNRQQIPAAAWDSQRTVLTKEVLKRLIQNKLVLVDARRALPPEALPSMKKRVEESFEEEHISKVMEDMKVATRAELEAKLLEIGSSIEAQKRNYFERSIASYWVGEKVKDDAPVGYAELYDYYREHVDEYEHEAKAKWEQLSAPFNEYSSKQEAYNAIAEMGNDVVIRRIPFAAVAKAKSKGLSAADGGTYDWTTQGALRSEVLDRALFGLPVGMMSGIIEDDTAFHIIRVTERQPTHRTSFRDAQVEIEKKIRKQRRKKNLDEYYERLSKEIQVWTVFDDAASSGRPTKF
jgi:hypothetical protein